MTNNPNNTETKPEIQVPDVIELRVRQLRLGLTVQRIAKELNRTQSAISHAYRGRNPKMLYRIDRYLSRIERNRKGATA